MFNGKPDQFHLQFSKSVAYGIVNPIITDCKGLVIDGERRIKAILAIEDVTTIPCRALDEALEIKDAIFLRVLLNPGKAANLWARNTIGGHPFRTTRHDRFANYSAIFAIHERAADTITHRVKHDLQMQQMIKRHDATLLETAKHLVNSLRCLQSIGLNCVNGLPPNLEKTKALVEEAIQLIVNPS